MTPAPRSALRRHWRSITAVTAMAVDASMLVVAFAVAGVLSTGEGVAGGLWLLTIAVVTFLVASTSLGLYRIIGNVPARVHAALASRAYLAVVTVMVVALFPDREVRDHRDLLAAFFPIFPLLYTGSWTVLRLLFRKLRARRLGTWRTLVLGVDPGMERVLRRVRTFPELGYDIVRVLSPSETGQGLLHIDSGRVERSIREDGIELILLSSSFLDASLERLEDVAAEHGVGVRLLSKESDEVFLRTRIYDIAGIPLVWPEPMPVERLKRMVKRAFDLVGGAVLLILLSPVFGAIALATRLESRGPVIFRQRRALAAHQPPFEVFKFRSMVHGSGNGKDHLAEKNEAGGLLFKIREDPRRTRVGKVVRRHSLDELPQLMNVIRGEMSLVGPRPLPVEDFTLLDDRDALKAFVRQRVRARPGMTGLWQIAGRSDLGFREMVLLDLYYVQHQNLLFDLEILFRTLPVVIFGRGAY
jgi:exopolysaccharide biosynthesis polyprenyl glycosylphosphotransferase